MDDLRKHVIIDKRDLAYLLRLGYSLVCNTDTFSDEHEQYKEGVKDTFRYVLEEVLGEDLYRPQEPEE